MPGSVPLPTVLRASQSPDTLARSRYPLAAVGAGLQSKSRLQRLLLSGKARATSNAPVSRLRRPSTKPSMEQARLVQTACDSFSACPTVHGPGTPSDLT